jgi:hypothetical protein
MNIFELLRFPIIIGLLMFIATFIILIYSMILDHFQRLSEFTSLKIDHIIGLVMILHYKMDKLEGMSHGSGEEVSRAIDADKD